MSNWKTVKQSQEDGAEQAHKKQGKKRSGRKFAVILPLLTVVIVAAAALFWALPHLPVKPQTQNGASYRGVVELWNVESFEGGVGSRESWLKSRAASFEKANEGLFVHVTSLTVEQLSAKLDAGDGFDMICFSRGAGAVVKERLATVNADAKDVRDNMLVSGQVNGVQYALPVYAGVYCLFARAQMLGEQKLPDCALSATYTRKVGKNSVELRPLVTGFTPYNSPLSALAMSGGKGRAVLSDSVTQYEAYESFLANRTAVTLLGTQRDMYRLSQKEQNGRIEPLAFAPLVGYTDLVQYVGVSNSAQDKADACSQFASYLVSEEAQSTLVNLCMFSVLDGSFYTSDRYTDCEAGLANAYVPNVFGDSDAVARQRRTAIETLAV